MNKVRQSSQFILTTSLLLATLFLVASTSITSCCSCEDVCVDIEDPDLEPTFSSGCCGERYYCEEPSLETYSPSSVSYGTLTYEGKDYKTFEIGPQTWMAENLNYDVNGSICYDNNPDNCDIYGRLYNWATAMEICPEGWRLPSNADWRRLFVYIGGPLTPDFFGSFGYDFMLAQFLKTESGWNDNRNGEDRYGFSALPGGLYNNGIFEHIGEHGYWWSSNENDIYGKLIQISSSINMGKGNKAILLSVRCIKD